ncbi:NAD(P)H-dependent glycerol-3-phosphate dehydrogenase [Treponema parvum]|uniref:NAD(P)H-dependent glycerol-3-phosphate dehydrogenase n=1 Tax=Treponema parvum TaxID=138851 RepID=UPI001AEBFB43|nr:NAD(P)H-dependent glycerol-3-phosphate dehydrogenase [Treponema parvum]QTQ15728.1 NAD(P)-dependent glycerol-3-phosphate dehydrogenase [Treponema parvum]
MERKKVGIIGSGAWGTAMAQALARAGHHVQLYTRSAELVQAIRDKHENLQYLPGYALSKNVTASTDIAEVADDKDFLFLASPSLYLLDNVNRILNVPSVSRAKTNIGILTKGFFSTDDGPKMIMETLESILPEPFRHNLVYVAGPSHAEEVAVGKLTGLIAASENPKNSIMFRDLLRVPGLMVYSSFDVIGVQVCAAVKNVIAVVYGSLDAIAENSAIFGDNAESLLLAAGLNEIQTIGFAMGATHAETFTSISGVGDLYVSCKSKYGRNRRFGHDIIKNSVLTKFKDLDDLIANISSVGYLPEGVVACKYVAEIAEKRNLRLTICNGLYRILNREIEPEDFLMNLLMRG